ncbi:Anaphase-promoting complex subunit 1, partial [Coemansia thaxteri]
PSLSVQRRASAAVSAAAIAATSRRKSNHGSTVKNNRRNSLLGRVSFNDSPGANYVADVFRDQRPTRAEIVLHLCWKESRQRVEPPITDPMAAKLFAIQTAIGNDVVCVFYPDIELLVGLETSGFVEVFRHSVRSVALVHAVRPDVDDLLVVTSSGSVALAFGGGEELVLLETPFQRRFSTIRCVEGEWATLVVGEGNHEDTVMSTRIPISRLVLAALDSLSFVLSPPSCSVLRRCAIASICRAKDDLDQIDKLALLLTRGDDKSTPTATIGARVKKEVRDRAAAVQYALHLVYEDAAMRNTESAARLYAFGQLLVLFAQQHVIVRAKQQYLCAGFRAPASGSAKATASRPRADCAIHSLPLFSKWLLAISNPDEAAPLPFPSFGSIGELFGLEDCKPAQGAPSSLWVLDTMANIFFRLCTSHNYSTVFLRLAADTDPLNLLHQLTPDLQWLISMTIVKLRGVCSNSWPAPVLALLGRQDLLANFCLAATDAQPHNATLKQHRPEIGYASSDEHMPIENKSVVDICEEAVELLARSRAKNTSGSSLERSTRALEFSNFAFGSDLRVDEAGRLLCLDAAVHTNTSLANIDSSDSTESASALYLDQVASRVLALPLGRSLFDFSTRNLNSQDALAIARPKVSARFRGLKSDIPWTAGATEISWSLFHSGVAAALSIERDQVKDVHPSWVLLNWPSDLDSDLDAATNEDMQKRYRDSLALHAGFLLGMGLLPRNNEPTDGRRKGLGRLRSGGPLCDIPPWQVFKYLSIRHGLTSIALLVGSACAHRGTMNSSVSKILSLHIPNLLPPGSSELMLLSYGTQAAAMLGLGLLFMGSQNRRMVEVMLRELSGIKRNAQGGASSRLDSSDPAESTAECYSLASGFALGLVVLGRGPSTQSLADLQLLDTLSEMMGSSHPGRLYGRGARDEPSHEAPDQQSSANGDEQVSNLGLISAIGLVFIGTNYEPAAQRLALPSAVQQLRTADPFMLLWKSLMRSLIMLDSILPTKLWVEAAVPLSPAAKSKALPADLCRVRLNIVAAACFAVALKYAGTEDRAAHATILAYFDEIEAIASKPALGYEPNLTRACAQSCLDILCTSAALVMAGSGDISTMARLRALHGVSSSRRYGNHMALHMALGMLFLGGGAQFTLSRSLESISMLLISLFPRFPRHYTDNHEHLQAWRHIWALCVEPRCLVVRDAATGKMCRNATVTIHRPGSTTDVQDIETLATPVPVLSLASAVSVRLQAPGYLPLEVDLLRMSATRQQLQARRVLYMQSDVDILETMVSGHGNLGMRQQYCEWLSSAQVLISNVVERLAANSPDAAPDLPSVASAVRAVERLRMCVRLSRYISTPGASDDALALGASGPAKDWTELTYVAWMSARAKILTLSHLETIRRMVTIYWTGSQLPGGGALNSDTFYSVVGLLKAALDLPAPTQAMDIAKHIPMATLVDFVLM